MPNHVHILLNVDPIVGARYIAPATTQAHASLGCLKTPEHGDVCVDFHHNSKLSIIVGGMKAAVTRECRMLVRPDADSRRARCIAPLPEGGFIKIWQRLFHEHIVRDQRAFDNIVQYIDDNAINWANDCFYQEYS